MRVNLNARNIVLQQIPKNSIGVEIGVHMGDFSAQIMSVADPRRLYLVDPYKHFQDTAHEKAWYGGKVSGQDEMDKRYTRVQERFKAYISDGRMQIIRKMIAEAAEQFEAESLDFVYIDGDHTFEGVLADIQTYLPKLKSGGLMIGDDYSLGGWWGSGVVDAFHYGLHSEKLKVDFAMDNQIVCRKLPSAH